MYASQPGIGKALLRGMVLLSVIALAASFAAAQPAGTPDSTAVKGTPQPMAAPHGVAPEPDHSGVLSNRWDQLPPGEISYFRPHDARGLNMFESPKHEGIPYTGNKIQWGAAFAQQFQHLTHDNSAVPVIVGGVDKNQLIDIGPGFNNADANLFLDAQIERGIRVALTLYLSSRHHNETWVKDGFIQFDGSPIDHPVLNSWMKYLTLKAGHFEINYGDQHFRDSDNGNTVFNPFVGNLIMRGFTTEIGAELYYRTGPWMAMGGMTGGEIHGQVTQPEHRTPTYLGKGGFDSQISPALRVRLTGSVYRNAKTVGNTLYSGSRAGSRYYDVLENTQSTESAQAWSGEIQPGFTERVTAFVANPFIKFKGLELFGNIEQAEGGGPAELANRKWRQNAGEAVYRIFHEQLYGGFRFDRASGVPAGLTQNVTVDRMQYAGGWYLTPRLLGKVEYVRQLYMDYPATDIHAGGVFQGFMFEGVVAF